MKKLLYLSLKDNIPNVRFYTIKLIEKIWNYFDINSKKKLEINIKSLINDEDDDVKYFANKFIEAITIK